MPPKQKLKDEINQIKKEYAAEQRRKAAEKAASDAKKEQNELREAKLIVAALPGRVREAVGLRTSLHLCSGDKDGVGKDLSSCSGLAAKIIKLFEDEGLKDHVFVDIDCSGNWFTEDELKFHI